MSATERAVQPSARLTYREAKYVRARIEGKSEADSLRAAGFSESLAHVPSKLSNIIEMRAEVDRLQAELAANTIQAGLIDAIEIHEYLTDALRAKISDILDDEFCYKPLNEWPEIWQRMYEAGDLEITTENERSHDGKTTTKRGGWDESGTITKVKFKFASRAKLLELAMKHRGVNAMVDQKGPDVHVHMHAEITQKLQGALARKARLIEGKDETK